MHLGLYLHNSSDVSQLGRIMRIRCMPQIGGIESVNNLTWNLTFLGDSNFCKIDELNPANVTSFRPVYVMLPNEICLKIINLFNIRRFRSRLYEN